MRRFLAGIPGAARATRTGLVLAVLLLGSAGHWWHHVQDPACADGADRAGHACSVCSGMHASSLAATVTPVPVPLPTNWQLAPAVPALAPRACARIAAAPRAPPEG